MGKEIGSKGNILNIDMEGLRIPHRLDMVGTFGASGRKFGEVG